MVMFASEFPWTPPLSRIRNPVVGLLWRERSLSCTHMRKKKIRIRLDVFNLLKHKNLKTNFALCFAPSLNQLSNQQCLFNGGTKNVLG